MTTMKNSKDFADRGGTESMICPSAHFFLGDGVLM